MTRRRHISVQKCGEETEIKEWMDGWKQKEGKKGLVGGAENEPFCL